MANENERRILTSKEAEHLLIDGEHIHTFANPNGRMLLGCDLSRKSVLKMFSDYEGKVEIGGDSCRNMGHGIVVLRENGPLFIETDEEKLNKFDPLT